MTFTRRTGFWASAASTGNPPTISITPQAVGDLIIVGIGSFNGFGGGPITVACTNVGGGFKTVASNPATASYNTAVAWGIATSTATATLSVTYPSVSSDFTDICVDSWVSAGAVSYAATQAGAANGSGTTAVMPNLASGANGGLYWAFGSFGGGTVTAPSGFTVTEDNSGNYMLYNASLSAVTHYDAEAVTLGASSAYFASGAIFAPSASGTAATISRASGFPVSSSATGNTTQAVTTVLAGDIVMVAVRLLSSTITVTGVSSPHTTGWTKAAEFSDSADTRYLAVWYGTVSTAGSDTITVAFSSSVSAVGVEIAVDSLTGGTNWTIDISSATNYNGVTGTTVTYPSLTPTRQCAYWGFARSGTGINPGSTSGVTYWSSAAVDQIAFDPVVTSGSTLQPTATNSSATNWDTVAALINATGTTVAPHRTNMFMSFFRAGHATSVTSGPPQLTITAVGHSSVSMTLTTGSTSGFPQSLPLGVAAQAGTTVGSDGYVNPGSVHLYDVYSDGGAPPSGFRRASWYGQSQLQLYGNDVVITPATDGLPTPPDGNQYVARLNVDQTKINNLNSPTDNGQTGVSGKLYYAFGDPTNHPAASACRGTYKATYYVPSSLSIPTSGINVNHNSNSPGWVNFFQYKQNLDDLWWVNLTPWQEIDGTSGYSWVGPSGRPANGTRSGLPAFLLNHVGFNFTGGSLMQVPLDRWFTIQCNLDPVGGIATLIIDGTTFQTITTSGGWQLFNDSSHPGQFLYGVGNYTNFASGSIWVSKVEFIPG